MGHSEYDPGVRARTPWNAGRKLGAKRALKLQQGWAIRFWLDRERRLRDRSMFDLAIDSKLHGCDIVKIRIGDLVSGGRVRSRAIVIQRKTRHPVQFELLEPARASILVWLERRGGTLRIRCDEPRRRSSTSKPATCEPCRSSSATRRSRALCGTSASTSRTRSPSLRPPRSDGWGSSTLKPRSPDPNEVSRTAPMTDVGRRFALL
jgi:hypothetical protein